MTLTRYDIRRMVSVIRRHHHLVDTFHRISMLSKKDRDWARRELAALKYLADQLELLLQRPKGTRFEL